MTALDEIKTAQAQLHASSYWKPGSKGWATTHLSLSDAAMQRAIADVEPVPAANPVPPPASGCLPRGLHRRKEHVRFLLPHEGTVGNAPVVDQGTSDRWAQFENADCHIRLVGDYGRVQEDAMVTALERANVAVVLGDAQHEGHRERMRTEADAAGWELLSLRQLTLDSRAHVSGRLFAVEVERRTRGGSWAQIRQTPRC